MALICSRQGCQAYCLDWNEYTLEGIRRGDHQGDGISRREANHLPHVQPYRFV